MDIDVHQDTTTAAVGRDDTDEEAHVPVVEGPRARVVAKDTGESTIHILCLLFVPSYVLTSSCLFLIITEELSSSREVAIDDASSENKTDCAIEMDKEVVKASNRVEGEDTCESMS